ncbi:MAG: DUF4159 domain-containing protein [Caulobacterales bacterium]
MTLGPLVFAAPFALLGLLTLPVLWWLLRATPPPPARATFPPARLLLDLKTEEQSRERAPLWLVIFRALAAALLIVGFARPSLAPQAAEATGGGGRMLIVIDDGWTSAPFWSDARNAAIAAARQAETGNGQVFLLRTAPQIRPSDAGEALTGADARARIAQIEPASWRPDRADALRRLNDLSGNFARIFWITDGLEDQGAAQFARTLAERGPVTARIPARGARALTYAEITQNGVEIEARRGPGGGAEGAIAVETQQGRSLGSAPLRFDGNVARATIALPPEIAQRAARVRIVGEESAGAVRLMANGANRPRVGLVDAASASQPLLSELYYVERALSPYASLQRGEVRTLIDARVQAMIMPDAAAITPGDRVALERWIERGGLLVRFAGPRLADSATEPLPVRLRPGARAIGGALAWERPQHIRAFAEDSPFSGLTAPSDVAVRRQVLAEPSSIAQAHVWAALEDGSPLVTAAQRERGLVVLYHVSARPDWSDVPLSGLFVDMLRRTMAFAGRAEGAAEEQQTIGPYTPQRLLDGYGALEPAPRDAQAIPADQFARATPSAATPPGLYERAGLAAAIDAARPSEQLSALQLPNGVTRAGLSLRFDRPLTGLFLGLAALMMAIDLLIALFIAGRLPQIRLPKFGAAALLLIALLPLSAPYAHAQSNDPTIDLHLAYVRTGDTRIDSRAREGLVALSTVLRNRTSVEPGAPVAVDLARDDLSPYPFIYWAASDNPQPLPDAALANLERYLRLGGLLLVDTRDAGRSTAGRPAATMLQGLDAPPLEVVTTDHVVARSFYLMRAFPGRTMSTRLWAESASASESRDGVASLFIGDGDWASAWASDAGLSNGARQRELALRFGVNLVMVSLTGNYKADQVHIPALLERMGQERR